VHQGNRFLRQLIPAIFTAYLDIRPAAAISEHHDHGLGLFVHLVFLLAVGITEPVILAEGQNFLLQGFYVVLAQLFQGNTDIHQGFLVTFCTNLEQYGAGRTTSIREPRMNRHSAEMPARLLGF
jgi:hypothetical protein